ncbi:TPA: prepilin-type N-terminal cleavage/methylation domain-containing protein [Vibrio vulnificus]|uniref:prepilin-type N-terminal cleavage/methylation domain-containing protein n=1 Tax=Vibrio vulnificus TaxID=672 RepID=UPI0015F82E3D|nr:prepilin-type N-terminal cleavage/methylation domain-containing protein [Vibrio vulnificus]MCA0767300.1 prepilin-type N-terminal cleavage/methylation domain-containing protein [Vibrio vulnificus]MDT9658174.1 prepilin-type N-terminal cleavage/methylation domain-containing protein [Vibrio vulnificus]QMV36007.1 prepilin-type N-terminal cleavage/methylation domain-containing protein [Vibrio vulnificus]HAS6198879.1 prepilin-type N-terminal cleavage/methylation domain-containing protein [Vibrio vu
MKKHQGMTLIESIVAMVLIAVAMVTLTSLLFPNVKNSAAPHYQTRAIALGQGFMSQILARGFDHHSNFDGGGFRCGEQGSSCTAAGSLGAEELHVADYNDVDDYIGCWYTANTQSQCPAGTIQKSLADVFGSTMDSEYPNFRVEVNVFYDEGMDGGDDGDIGVLKRIEMQIYAGQHGPYPLVAYKGNY